MVEGLHLVSKLRCNAVLWVPYTGLPRKGPGRPRKHAGRFDRARIPELPAIDLSDEGRRLHHTQLYYKPFQRLLRVVFVLDIDADPEEARPVTLFATDPEMAPEQIYRIHRDRFQIEFNFRDASSTWGWPPARPAPKPATTSTSTPYSRPWPGPGSNCAMPPTGPWRAFR